MSWGSRQVPHQKLPPLLTGTGAQRKLLYLTNYLESAGWVGIVICREGVFQALPRNKITEAFSRIWDAGNSKQVALLANARASFGLKFRGIDNGARVRGSQGVLQMGRDSVRRLSLLQEKAENDTGSQCPGREARYLNGKARILADRADEIRVPLVLKTWSQVVSVPALVIGNWRLEQISAKLLIYPLAWLPEPIT